jgi:hypothetical protein
MSNAIIGMITSELETKVYNQWVADKGNLITETMKCGEVTCSVNPAHVKGHFGQRPRFTWLLNGKRISKADLLKVISNG